MSKTRTFLSDPKLLNGSVCVEHKVFTVYSHVFQWIFLRYYHTCVPKAHYHQPSLLCSKGTLSATISPVFQWHIVFSIFGSLRHLFLKLDTLMYLSSCSVVHRGLPLLFLFWLDSLRCSVKGVVHSVVRDLQFLGNFSHGIAFISQNKN